MPADSAVRPAFSKHYADPSRSRAAAARYRWLTRLGAPTPRLLTAQDARLDFEHITGHHAGPDDVPAVAALLGRLHAAAHCTSLRASIMDATVLLDDGHAIPGFAVGRTVAIRKRLATGCVPDPRFTGDQAERLIHGAAGQLAAFYKDTNLRNVLVTTGGPILVDFDDLTLAPFGYDLAKLLLTIAMTYGQLPAALIGEALAAYNRAATETSGTQIQCSLPELTDWIEIHHILTSPYLGHNGYHHSWHTLRPKKFRTRTEPQTPTESGGARWWPGQAD
jgi:hypothetical protein